MKTPLDIPYWKRIYADLPAPERALAWADSQVGVREEGSNRGPEVQEYQSVAGLGTGGGSPWCAAFVYWCLRMARVDGGKLPTKGKCAAVRNWHSWANQNRKKVSEPERGDLFYWLNSNMTGHIGFVLSKPIMGVFRTIEGNTDGESGSREGDGVYKRTRTIWGLKRKYRHGFIRV